MAQKIGLVNPHVMQNSLLVIISMHFSVSSPNIGYPFVGKGSKLVLYIPNVDEL